MKKTALLLLALACLAGCSYVKSSKRLDLTPFAENTVSLAADIEYGLTDASRAIHLREYWNSPAVLSHRKEWDKVRALMKGVVAYSVEITTLGNSNLDGPARCQALADFLDPLARPVILAGTTRLHLTESGLDSMLVEIRERRTFLDGLAVSQRIVDEIDRISREIFDEVKVSLDDTARELMRLIDEDNSAAVHWDKVVRRQQYSKFEALGALAEYRLGEDGALERLWEIDPYLKYRVSSEKSLTSDEIQQLEDRLLYKIQAYREFAEQIQPDLEEYAIQQQEIAELYTKASLQLKRARTTMAVWARSHRNLAQGVTDPAKVNLFDVTKKAIKTAL